MMPWKESLNNYDNVLALFLTYLSRTKTKVKNIYLAGIDGYQESNENYSTEEIVLTDKKYMKIENDSLKKTIGFYAQKFYLLNLLLHQAFNPRYNQKP